MKPLTRFRWAVACCSKIGVALERSVEVLQLQVIQAIAFMSRKLMLQLWPQNFQSVCPALTGPQAMNKSKTAIENFHIQLSNQ